MLATGFSASSFSFLHVQKFPVINCVKVTHSPSYSTNLALCDLIFPKFKPLFKSTRPDITVIKDKQQNTHAQVKTF